MLGTRAILVQHGIMELGAIALVLMKGVLGISRMQFPSGITVTADLRQDGRRRNGGTLPVALDDGNMGRGNGKSAAMVPVSVDQGRERENSMGPGIFTKYAKQVIDVCVALLVIVAILAVKFG